MGLAIKTSTSNADQERNVKLQQWFQLFVLITSKKMVKKYSHPIFFSQDR